MNNFAKCFEVQKSYVKRNSSSGILQPNKFVSVGLII